MTLAEYMKKTELTDAEMAKLVGKVSRQQIGHLRTGIRRPSMGLAERIEKVTGGKVRVQSWAVAA